MCSFNGEAFSFFFFSFFPQENLKTLLESRHGTNSTAKLFPLYDLSFVGCPSIYFHFFVLAKYFNWVGSYN